MWNAKEHCNNNILIKYNICNNTISVNWLQYESHRLYVKLNHNDLYSV